MDDKLKRFDPTQYYCFQHPRNKLHAINLFSSAGQRLLCSDCIQDHSNSLDINKVLTKNALDDLINSLMQLYYQEISNENHNILYSQVDNLFDELYGLLRVLRAKIKERVSNALKSSLNSDTMQHVENLHLTLVEKITKFANDPSLLKEGQDIEDFVKVYNFIYQLKKENLEEKQKISQNGLSIVQAAKEQVVPIKKNIVRWLEDLMENSKSYQTVHVQAPVLKTSDQNGIGERNTVKQGEMPSLAGEQGIKPERISLKPATNPIERISLQRVESPENIQEANSQKQSIEVALRNEEVIPKDKYTESPLDNNQDSSLEEEAERELPRMHTQEPSKASDLNSGFIRSENIAKMIMGESILKTPSSKTADLNPSPSSGTQLSNTFQAAIFDSGNLHSQNSPDVQIEEKSLRERTSHEYSEERKELKPSPRQGLTASALVTPLRKVISDIRDNYTLGTLFDDKSDQLSEIADLEVNLRYRDLDDKGVKEVASKVKLLRHLAALALDFSSCTKITDFGVCALASELSSLSFLEALSLKFNNCCMITDKSMLKLASTLNKLKKLELVSIQLNSCYQITDEGLIQLALGVNRLLKLHTLVVDVSFCNNTNSAGITDYGIAQFAVYLKQVSSLQNLTLNLSSWNVDSHPLTDQGLNDFALNISKLHNLKTLKLDFTWCINFTDKGMQNMANSFSRLKLLTVLKLDFSWCKYLTDRGVGPFSSAIAKLSALKTLHLNFSYCNQIHDEAIREFAEALVKLPKLAHLALNFTWCSGISDIGLIYLSQQLPNLPELESLALHFNNSSSLSDQGITELSNCLPALKKLQNLTLYFTHCSQISEMGHNALVDQLGLLIDLKRISLYFTACKNITEENINLLSTNLRKMVGLKALTLDYSECPNITKQCVANLKQAMNEIEELKGMTSYNFEGKKVVQKENNKSITMKPNKEDFIHAYKESP